MWYSFILLVSFILRFSFLISCNKDDFLSLPDALTVMHRFAVMGRTGDGLGPLVCCRKACLKAKRRVGV